jgi:C-terminal processing protease CtpA/Prc
MPDGTPLHGRSIAPDVLVRDDSESMVRALETMSLAAISETIGEAR